MMSANAMNQDQGHSTGIHILPLKIYLSVFTVLLVMTFITVYVSFFNFGAGNLVVAMVIAAVKATLVAMFFMHLKYDNKLYSLIIVGSVLFLAAFMIFTMYDTLRRGEIYEIRSGPIRQNASIYDSLKATAPATDSTLVDTSGVEAKTGQETKH